LTRGIAGPLALALVTAAPRASEDAPHTSAPAPAASLTSRAGGSDAGSPAGPIAVAQPGFLDADRGGTAAYGRGDFESAIAQYRAAIERNPKNLDALNNLGQALVRAGRAAEGVPFFERAIALNATDWAPRFNLAHAYGSLQDWPHAVTAYRAALQVFPDDYVTSYNLGLALHRAGQEEEAVDAFKKAIRLAPGEPSFHLSLGISFERLHRPADAVQAYEDYLEMAPGAADTDQVKTRIDSLRKSG